MIICVYLSNNIFEIRLRLKTYNVSHGSYYCFFDNILLSIILDDGVVGEVIFYFFIVKI